MNNNKTEESIIFSIESKLEELMKDPTVRVTAHPKKVIERAETIALGQNIPIDEVLAKFMLVGAGLWSIDDE